MDPIIAPALVALANVLMRAIAAAESLARLRSQERQQRAHRFNLSELPRVLPPDCQLAELRANNSTLHLVIKYTPEPGERPST